MGRYKQPYTLYKRGKYWYYKTYDNLGIRTAGKSTGQTTKTGAREYCERLYLTNGLFTSDITFIEYSLHFFDADSLYFTARSKKPTVTTINQYQHHYTKNILPFFKNYKLKDINYTALMKFQKSLIDAGFSDTTTRTILIILRQIINYAYKDQIILKNPFDYFSISSGTQSNRDAFTLEEVKYIYSNIAAEYKNAVLLLALTGLRASEFVALVPSDVLKHKDGFYYLDIQRQNYYGKVLPPKQESYRNIPIIDELAPLVEEHLHRYKLDLYSELKKIVTGLEDHDARKLSLHSFRHFFITSSKSANVNDVKVEFIAGHKLKGIVKTYTNFRVEDLKDILSWQKDIYTKLTL